MWYENRKLLNVYFFLRVFVFGFWCFVRLPARGFLRPKLCEKERSSSEILFFRSSLIVRLNVLCVRSGSFFSWYERIILSASSSLVLCLILYFLGKVHKYLAFFLLWLWPGEEKKYQRSGDKKDDTQEERLNMLCSQVDDKFWKSTAGNYDCRTVKMDRWWLLFLR